MLTGHVVLDASAETSSGSWTIEHHSVVLHHHVFFHVLDDSDWFEFIVNFN